MRGGTLLRLVIVTALISLYTVSGANFTPLIIVYDSGMPDFASGVAQILKDVVSDDARVVVEKDPMAVASLLSYPNVKCVVLTSVSSGDLNLLVKPMMEYFQAGGAAIGFHGVCWETKVGEMAKQIFPVFGNATLPGVRRDGTSYVEYHRVDQTGFCADLPDKFQLVGQFFVFQADRSRQPIIPKPVTGSAKILFEEPKTGAPLVIAYESPSGARSVCLPGLFLRDNPSMSSYYGLLLQQAEFASLLKCAYLWTVGGNPRFDKYSANYQQLVREKQREDERLLARGRSRESSRRRGRILLLGLLWLAGLGAVAYSLRWGFKPSR